MNKLSLNRETLKVLSEEDSQVAAGVIGTHTYGIQCIKSVICPTTTLPITKITTVLTSRCIPR